jgi:transcriptional regulator with XRE-family HTH domain
MDEHWQVDSPSDAVVWRLRELRKQRGWSAARLADECKRAGFPQLTASVIANIESGRPDAAGHRRRAVTVDELWALARTLQVSMGALLWPLVNRDPGGRAAILTFTPAELHELMDVTGKALARMDVTATARGRVEDAGPAVEEGRS